VDWHGLNRRFRLAGWCFSKNGEVPEGLRVYLADREFFVSYGLARPDVARTHPDQANALQSGFEVMIEVPRGAVHNLRLEACHRKGLWREVFSQRIVVSRKAGGSYADWIRKYDTLRWRDRSRIRKQIQTFRLKPRFSILLPLSGAPPSHLTDAIDSVCLQLYPGWQLILVPDAPLPDNTRRLLVRLAGRDSRIELRDPVKEGGTAAALNEALTVSGGEFVLLLGSEDKLAPTALYFLAHVINSDPEVCLIYADEDKLDSEGFRADPHFKPDWNWELLLAQDYVSHLAVFRANLLKSLGFRPNFGEACVYDLLLRFSERIKRHHIHHLPHVLYHRRTVPPSVSEDQRLIAGAIKAAEENLERQRVAADVTRARNGSCRRVHYLLRGDAPTVSIIIPTRDRVELLRPCVESILEKTTYSRFEIVLIDNGSRETAALEYLSLSARNPRTRILQCDEEFNYSRLSNFGVERSEAEFVVLMNNDVEVIAPGWLDEMVSHGIQPEVGAVGARLLYPDGRVQQAGVILGAGVHGVAEVAHRGIARSDPGYFSRAILAQELSAIGAACLLTRRKVYLKAGGFDEKQLKVAFNDIDFCLKLRARGYRILYAPEAELYHHEHASRGSEYTSANERRFIREIEFMKEKWKDALLTDPNYNPNLSLGSELFTLAFPPRVTKPWQSASQ
jgi:GT2 family glycosyltransferase